MRLAAWILLAAAAAARGETAPMKSLADTLTDDAIALATAGRMEEALEMFF